MTRIILRHREVGRVVTTMARMIHNSVTVGIQSNLDKWRKSVGQLERKHNKHYKSARSTLQRKSETLGIMLLKTKIINCRCQLAKIGETENPLFIQFCKTNEHYLQSQFYFFIFNPSFQKLCSQSQS